MNEISAFGSERSAEDQADATGLIRGLGWLGVTSLTHTLAETNE